MCNCCGASERRGLLRAYAWLCKACTNVSAACSGRAPIAKSRLKSGAASLRGEAKAGLPRPDFNLLRLSPILGRALSPGLQNAVYGRPPALSAA